MGKEDYEMKSRGLNRGGSLFGPDPQTQLLNALHQRNFGNFSRLLSNPDIDLEFCYDYPDYKTCLDISCSEKGMQEYIKVLLERNVDLNKVNTTHKRTPLHFAAESGNLEAVEILLDNKAEVNTLCKGDTALHLVIKKIEDIDDDRESVIEIYEDIVKLLVIAGTDVNIPDLKNITPIYSAAKQGLEKVIKILIENSEKPIDIDSYKDRRHKTARTLLENTFPHLLSRITSNEKQNENISVEKLFSHLNSHDEEKFIKDFKRIEKADYPKFLSENNGLYTLLQYACNNGMEKVVMILLEKGADPNLTAPGNSLKPIFLACRNGFHKILQHLLNHPSTSIEPIDGETLLQVVITENRNVKSNENCDYNECFKILLDNSKECANINYVDVKGNSVLHYATRSGDHEKILELLRKGSYIGIRNKFNEMPLVDMTQKTLQIYLDECVTTNNERPNDEDYEIQFNYNFLVPSNNAIDKNSVKIPLMQNSNINANEYDNYLAPETDPLLYMSKHSELKHLLKHPVITSFLYLKWQRISCLFYTNIAFYAIFWISLMLHILFSFSFQEKNDIIYLLESITRYTTIIGLIFLMIREITQISVSPKTYFQSIENWLEMCLIIITSIIMFGGSTPENPRQELFAIAILLSSAELILLIGQFPTLSTNIVMLKTVSWNFFKFLLWYCILIIAFALSFYTLFRTVESKDNNENNESIPFNPNKQNNNDDEKETDFFLDPGMSLFKTIVMLTGELDASSINFESFPVISHIIFIIFVFMIPIVLFNLLNGLAVSDTQAIRANAELVGHISRIQLISYFEKIVLGDITPYRNTISKIQNACCWLPGKMCIQQRFIGLRCFVKNICLFPNYLPVAQIGVKINQDSKVIIFPKDKMKETQEEDQENKISLCCFNQCNQYKMDRRIMKAAKIIINEKSSEESELKKIHSKLVDCEKKLENFEKLLSQIYNTIKNN